jgi:predicted phosphoribosyltransferase
MTERIFHDRAEAGRMLAQRLSHYRNRQDVIVLALPRGGVPVGYEVAAAIGAPLDVFLVRKLGVPGHRELAMGAIASGGAVVVNEDVVAELRIRPEAIEAVATEEAQELRRREQAYRPERPPLAVEGRTVILVDDGLATGASMRSAIKALRMQNPARLVVAVPVAPPATCRELQTEVDEVICLSTPTYFYAVGAAYRNFDQTTDEDVKALLAASN